MLEIHHILKYQSRKINILVAAVKKLFLCCLLFVGHNCVFEQRLTNFQDN